VSGRGPATRSRGSTRVRATIPAEYELDDAYIRTAEACCPPTGSDVEENTWGQIRGLLVRKMELEPDTGDILMYHFGLPPALPSRRTPASDEQTPASGETGVRIELVAGACYKAIHDAMGERLTKIWPLPRNGRRQVQSLPAPVEEDLHEYRLDAGPED